MAAEFSGDSFDADVLGSTAPVMIDFYSAT